MPCRVNRRRVWASRMVLEGLASDGGFFVTLTYSPENMPKGGSLVPRDPQLFLKRLRRKIGDWKLRYFLVGEYGDQTQRPHYHAALFFSGGSGSLDVVQVVKEAWQLGFVYTGSLTPQSAAYISGYVTKKMTATSDTRLNGRHPEFARMSLKPGIGATAMKTVSLSLQTDAGLNEIVKLEGDVPGVLKQGRSSLVLGRYLRRILRRETGLQEKVAPSKEYMLKLCLEFKEALEQSYDPSSKFFRKPTGKILMMKDGQRVLQMENRLKIKNGGKSL